MKGLYKKFFVAWIAGMIACGSNVALVCAEQETVESETAIEMTETVQTATGLLSSQLVDLISEKTGENVLVSGLSVRTALGMLAQGASGETLEQLEHVLGMDQESLKKVTQELLNYYRDLNDTTISMADGLWMDKDITVQAEYVKLLEEYFEATAESMDFHASDSADQINGWISEKTNGLIKEILDAASLQQMKVVLANTLYFKGGWMDPFVSTEEKEFQNLDGSASKVEMMSGSVDTYLENDAATGFMKYYGDGMAFVGILPKEEGEFSVEQLGLDDLIDSQTYDYEVMINLPKFKLECNSTLTEVLKELGMEKVFTAEAEFEGISESALAVSDILHNTCIEVDENGTEAAAVTAILMKAMALPAEEEPVVKEVNLDRPFAFGIYDTVNGEWAFTGKIVNLK